MAAPQDAHVVQLRDVSVRLFLESQDHQHDLIRELQLIGLSPSGDPYNPTRPIRLAAAIADVLSTYSPVRSSTREQAMAALDRGEDRVTLAVPVQEGMAEALRRWLQLLEEADQLCQHGELLLLATRPQIAEFRRWYVEQITAQLEAG
jgi:hypothetical protein